MKTKLFLIALCFLLYSPLNAYATESKSCSDGESVTGKTWYHSHCYTDNDTDTNTQLDDAWGAGADIELWTNPNEEGLLSGVHGEYRWDGNNRGRHSGYLVARINLWQKIKDILNK
jgi:hypothetical protein